MNPSCGGCVISGPELIALAIGCCLGKALAYCTVVAIQTPDDFRNYQRLKQDLARSEEDIEELKALAENKPDKYWKRRLEQIEETQERREYRLKGHTWFRRYERAQDWYQRTFKKD